MNEELKKWLKQNPPRVDLTELEKNLMIEDVDYKIHDLYFDDVGVDSICRLRVLEDDDRFLYDVDNGIKNGIDHFVLLWKSLGFCPLGYGVHEILVLDNMYGTSDIMVNY